MEWFAVFHLYHIYDEYVGVQCDCLSSSILTIIYLGSISWRLPLLNSMLHHLIVSTNISWLWERKLAVFDVVLFPGFIVNWRVLEKWSKTEKETKKGNSSFSGWLLNLYVVKTYHMHQVSHQVVPSFFDATQFYYSIALVFHGNNHLKNR